MLLTLFQYFMSYPRYHILFISAAIKPCFFLMVKRSMNEQYMSHIRTIYTQVYRYTYNTAHSQIFVKDFLTHCYVYMGKQHYMNASEPIALITKSKHTHSISCRHHFTHVYWGVYWLHAHRSSGHHIYYYMYKFVTIFHTVNKHTWHSNMVVSAK